MKKRISFLLLCLIIPTLTNAQPFQSDYSKLVTKGVEAYESGDYDSAKTAFKDALLLRPEGVEAQKNLALALSKLEEEAEAEEEYNRLINQDIDQQKKAEGYYNLSRLFLQKAQKEMESEEPDVKAVIKNASESIRNANRTLELEPENEQALNNKSQAQHILKQIAIAPPPQQQQQQGDGENDENEDQQDQQNSEQQNSDQQNNQDQNQQQQNQQGQNQQNQNQDQSQEQEQNQDSENSENEEQEEQDQNESDQNDNEEDSEQSEEEQQQNQAQQSESDGSQQGRAGDAEPVEMTKEQAEALLETLGETKRFVLSSPRYNPELHNSKGW